MCLHGGLTLASVTSHVNLSATNSKLSILQRKKMAKIKRKLDLTVITEKIRQHWIETFALAKKEQSRIDRKRMQMKGNFRLYIYHMLKSNK